MSTEDPPEITLTRLSGGRSARLDLVAFVVVLVGAWSLLAWAGGRAGTSAAGDRPARSLGDRSPRPDGPPRTADRTGLRAEESRPELAVVGFVRGTRLGGDTTVGARELPLGRPGPEGVSRRTAGRYLVVLHETAPGVYRGQARLSLAGHALVGSIELLGVRTLPGPSHWYSLASWWARPGAGSAAAADELLTLDTAGRGQVGPRYVSGAAATDLELTVEARGLRYAARLALTIVGAEDDAMSPPMNGIRLVR